jgi:hypothetical protein
MMHQSEREAAVVLCLFNDNVAEWVVQHTEDTEGDTIVGIEFADDHVTLLTDSEREIVIREDVYRNFGEPLACDRHVIREVDPFGNLGREYDISAPVVTAAPARFRN